MRVHSTEWIIQQVDISIEINSTSQAYTLFLSTTKVYTLKKDIGQNKMKGLGKKRNKATAIWNYKVVAMSKEVHNRYGIFDHLLFFKINIYMF